METMKRGTRWMLVGELGPIAGLKDDGGEVVIQWTGGVIAPLFGSEESMRDIQRKYLKLSGERLKLINVPDGWQFKPQPPIL